MAGTTNSPTMTAVLATYPKGAAKLSALRKWKADLSMSREEKRLVAQALNGSELGGKFEQLSGVFV